MNKRASASTALVCRHCAANKRILRSGREGRGVQARGSNYNTAAAAAAPEATATLDEESYTCTFKSWRRRATQNLLQNNYCANISRLLLPLAQIKH